MEKNKTTSCKGYKTCGKLRETKTNGLKNANKYIETSIIRQ